MCKAKITIRMIRGLSLLAILFLLMVSLFPITALAIADPDSPPQVNRVDVYSFTDGSLGVLIDYYLDYAVLPPTGETATESYIAIFIDTDGATQLKAVAPYTFVNSGYRRGMIWIPFTAAEVTTYGLTSANQALYRIWITGNPTLTWTPSGIPTTTVATIDDWHTSGVSVLLALMVLTDADILELAWTLDMIQVTSLGNRLTTTGESYFENVIPSLRTLAPSAFASGEAQPVYVPISYSTDFGATISNGTANVTGAPISLQIYGNSTSNTTVITTGVTTGTIVIDLANWTTGNVTSLGGTVTGSPALLRPGVNTVTVTAAGTLTVYAELTDAASIATTSVTGTGLDLTDIATAFGMSRWMFSGIIWMLITIIICASVYKSTSPTEYSDDAGGFGGTKAVLLVFTVSVIGGTLLGLLHPTVSALLFIVCGAFIGYVLFFRSESLHKGFMFLIWMFVVTSLAGNITASSLSGFVATRLVTDIPVGTVNSITVSSTTGFPSSGVIVIGDERIGYPSKTQTTFDRVAVLGVTTNAIVRGVNDTTEAAHTAGATVRTVESSILNSSIDYKIAQLVDSAGIMGYLTFPAHLLDLILTFFVLPIGFLGTDLAILTYVWMVIAIGMLVGFVTQLAGGRRV